VQKTGISYLDLEPGNEFRNRVQVPGFCYRSLQGGVKHYTKFQNRLDNRPEISYNAQSIAVAAVTV